MGEGDFGMYISIFNLQMILCKYGILDNLLEIRIDESSENKKMNNGAIIW